MIKYIMYEMYFKINLIQKIGMLEFYRYSMTDRKKMESP